MSKLYHELKTISTEEKNGRSSLVQLENLRAAYEDKQEKLPGLERALSEAVRAANDQVDFHVRYWQLSEDIGEIVEANNDLEALNPVVPDPDWSNHMRSIDINLRSVAQIKELVSFAVGLLKDSPTFEDIDEAWRDQDETITSLINEQNTIKQANYKLVHLLENSANEKPYPLAQWPGDQAEPGTTFCCSLFCLDQRRSGRLPAWQRSQPDRYGDIQPMQRGLLPKRHR